MINTSVGLEIGSAICSIVYSLLLMQEQKLGWLFGIISSLLGIVLFMQTRLYAQSLVSIYYAAIGVYGWIYWHKAEQRNEHIHIWKWRYHIFTIIACVIVSIFFSELFKNYTNSSSPLFDSVVTVFGVAASIKEARKVLSGWIYWLVINLASSVLFYQQHLYIYAALMIVYAGICVPGYFNWLRIYKQHTITSSE